MRFGPSADFRCGETSNDVMLRLHAHWLSVCNQGIGGRRRTLDRFADETAGASSRLRGPAAHVARLVAGFALVRAGRYSNGAAMLRQAEKGLLESKSLPDGRRTAAAVAAIWQAVSVGASGQAVKMRSHLKRAQKIKAEILRPSPALDGLWRLVEALEQYHIGKPDATLALLDDIKSAFHAPGSKAVDFDGFEAETSLLRGKILREMARYESALAAIGDARVFRAEIDDVLGNVSVCLERARIFRFQGVLAQSEEELRLAEALLHDREFTDWECRLHDQWGDIYRLEKEMDRAFESYQRARRLANSSRCEHALLPAHVDNSMARWHEEKGDYDASIGLLEKHAETWKKTRAQGKYLYLLGSVYTAAGDFRRAHEALTGALAELRESAMQSYVALALNRLAVLLSREAKSCGLRGDSARADELRREACVHWAEAIRVAQTDVDAAQFVDGLKANVGNLNTLDIVLIVSELQTELSELTRTAEAERASALQRHRRQQKMLGHYYVRTANRFLFGRAKRRTAPPAFLQGLASVVDSLNWWNEDYARCRAAPTDVDVAELVSSCRDRVSQSTKRRLRIEGPSGKVPMRVNDGFLGLAICALFRGLQAAFRVQTVEFAPKLRGGAYALDFFVKRPVVRNFARTFNELKFCDESVWDRVPTNDIAKAAYDGEILLADFVLQTAIWATLTAEDPNRVTITI